MDNPCWGGNEERLHNLHYLLKLIDAGFFSHATGETIGKTSCGTGNEGISGTISVEDEKKKNRIEMVIKKNIILFDNVDYLALNKPPDLRMDGPHLATVHKLVTFLYPPPSLLKQVMEEGHATKVIANENNQSNTETETTSEAATTSPLFLETISKLSKHSDLKDNIIRPTHQLDYATSGVLLLAKSKKKAAIACRAFEERTTKKEYLALVQGHIDVNATITAASKGTTQNDDESSSDKVVVSKFPQLNAHQKKVFDEWNDGTVEKNSKKERLDIKGGRKKLNTFAGYMPTHSIFSKWKGVQQRRRKRKICQTKDNEITDTNNDGEDVKNENDEFWNSTPSFTEEEEERLLNCSWKDVKKNPNKKNKLLFEALAKEFNDVQRKKHDKKIHAQKVKEETDNDSFDKHLPTFFRVAGDDDKTFYVQIPLADEKDSFRVVVQPDAFRGSNCGDGGDGSVKNNGKDGYISQYFPTSTGTSTDAKSKRLEFKPSLTKCVIQQLGFLGKQKVTKVLLHPRTGRRHQLRLHMAIIGHSILGDVTYEPSRKMEVSSSPISARTNDTEMKQSERIQCERMCLHAHKLSLPLTDGKVESFVAPDPFLYEESSSTFNLKKVKMQ